MTDTLLHAEPAGVAALLAPWPGVDAAPLFDRVTADAFLPAFRTAIADHAAEIAAIRNDPAPATFDTVIAALERAGAMLGRVRRLFWTLSSAHGTPAIRAIEAEVSALLARHGSAVGQDIALFARVAAVHADADRAGLTGEQRRLLDQVHDGFVRSGAALDPAGRQRLAAIDQRLAALSVAFGQNVVAATKAWVMLVYPDDCAGLPEPVIRAAARRADGLDAPGRCAFTLDRSDYEAFLGFAENRDLRERMWRGFTARCDGGAHDNRPLIAETLALRHERAGLLGYPDFATLKLADSMARTPQAAAGLLHRVWEPARAQALAEATELQALATADGIATLEPWDWPFYAERVRRDVQALDGAAVRRHLSLAAVRGAAFDAAGRLYGLAFTPRPDLPTWAPNVAAWAVHDASGADVGLLYTDYLARPEKHGGAWMGSLRVQEAMDGRVTPIVYTVANFMGTDDPADTRLSLDEARTLFHEFGHALHALLSDVTYPSLAGTAVARDFVEFPSKFMEHWILDAAVLGPLGMPAPLIAAIGAGETQGQGFATIEFLASAWIDLALHRGTPPEDAMAFAEAELARIGIPPAIGMRHRLPYFTHIFDGGYAAAYYSYLWAEILDTDAFDAFTEAGDIFAPTVAACFRREILAWGDARDPMDSFVAFRGRTPDEGPLLRSRGLA